MNKLLESHPGKGIPTSLSSIPNRVGSQAPRSDEGAIVDDMVWEILLVGEVV
jgi:hypothetical protein